MDVNIKKVEQVSVVEIIGEIDGKSAPQAQDQILSLIQPEAKILVDMSRVNYMSSAGLRMMLMTHRQASDHQAQVVLVGLSEALQDTMSATGFLRFFTTCDTMAAGLEALT